MVGIVLSQEEGNSLLQISPEAPVQRTNRLNGQAIPQASRREPSLGSRSTPPYLFPMLLVVSPSTEPSFTTGSGGLAMCGHCVHVWTLASSVALGDHGLVLPGGRR